MIGIGSVLILAGASALIYSFWPVAEAELKYSMAQIKNSENTIEEEPILPIDDQFGIVIPKIKANAPIVKNVDPYNAKEYQRQLSHGVAHAKGSGLPDSGRTMFLFAHSSGDILMARRYNSVFYLLNKLTKGDDITVYFQGAPYTYSVTETQEVTAEAVNYLNNLPNVDLILMTCTPPGTTWRRLLVLAQKS